MKHLPVINVAEAKEIERGRRLKKPLGQLNFFGHLLIKVVKTLFLTGQMGAYIDMQNFSQIGQCLKNLIFKGQPQLLLKKKGYILHYFA